MAKIVSRSVVTSVAKGRPVKSYMYTLRVHIFVYRAGSPRCQGCFSILLFFFPFFFPLKSLMFGPVCGMEVSREDGDDLAFCMPMASQCHASQPSLRRLGSCCPGCQRVGKVTQLDRRLSLWLCDRNITLNQNK